MNAVLNLGDVSISITNPRNQDVHYDIEQKGEEILTVRYEPKLSGNHCISITFNNQEIPQSPIKIYVDPDIDISKIKVTGIDSSNFNKFFNNLIASKKIIIK
jgi:hypothetical protein